MVPLAGVLLLVNILFLSFFVWLSAVYNITGDAGGQAQLGSVAFVAYPLWLAWVGARANSWRRRRLLWQGYEEVVDPEE